MTQATGDDAIRALALVEADADARARFAAAFTGLGEPVAALRERALPNAAAHAARETELDALRRAAFGRATTPQQEAAAAEAHTALAAAERAARAQTEALDAAIAVVLAPRAELPVALPAGETPAPIIRRPTWQRVLVPVATFAIGAAIAAIVVVTATPAAEPQSAIGADATDDTLAITPELLAEQAGASDEPGDIDAAERWLAQPQTAIDLVPVQLAGIDPASTRLASGGTTDGSVWVARGTDGELCLIAAGRQTQATASSCATPENFRVRGAMLSLNDGLVGVPSISASWDGAHVTVTIGIE